MKRKYIFFIVGFALLAFAGSYILYEVSREGRDVVELQAEETLKVRTIVQEYLDDPAAANSKYLETDGNSRIIEMSGTVYKISESGDGRPIVTIREDDQPAGFQCLFATGQSIGEMEKGNVVAIKGVIRGGPGYDEDLEIHENGYLEDCSLVESNPRLNALRR